MKNEKDEDLTYLTFIKWRKVKNPLMSLYERYYMTVCH